MKTGNAVIMEGNIFVNPVGEMPTYDKKTVQQYDN